MLFSDSFLNKEILKVVFGSESVQIQTVDFHELKISGIDQFDKTFWQTNYENHFDQTGLFRGYLNLIRI